MNKHILSALIALPAASACAQSTLEPIIITDSRTEKPVSESLSSVTVIDAEAIEQAQAYDMAELLRGVTGIDLGRNGGPGQTVSVFTRGTESDHTLVMIDGVPINPGTIGNPALQNIDPAMIDRIEIVRGPLSSLYGSAAIGGAINIVTKSADKAGMSLHAGMQVGSYNSVSLNAGTRMGEGPLSLSLDFSRQRSDGYAARVGDGFNSGTDIHSINTRLGYKLDRHSLQLQLFSTGGTTGYSLFGTPVDQDVLTQVVSGGITSRFGDSWISRLKLSRMIDEVDQNQVNYLSQYDFAHTLRDLLDWQHDLTLAAGNTLTVGLTVEREHTDVLSYGSTYDISLNNKAVFVQDQLRAGRHKALAALRVSDHEQFGQHLTWNLGYGYHLSDRIRLRASAGTAFRAPSTTDLYGHGGNPNLKPEESRSLELGMNLELDANSQFEVTAYDTRTSNLIVTNYYDLDGIDQYGDNILNDDPLNESVAQATIRGLELSYGYSKAPWRLKAGAEFKRPWDESNDVVLSRRARVAANASLQYGSGPWTFGANVQYQGKRDDSLWNNTILGSYTLVNVTARWQPSRTVTVEGRIENLFDTDYELAGGYNTPGRSVYLGLRVESD